MFDIDKMYIMFPSFNKTKNGQLKYVEYDYTKSPQSQSKESLQNRLIELYKSVLTHPEVIKDVMNPIDIKFIKDDITDLFPEQSDSNLTHFDAIKDIKLKYEFSAGKAGVGQEANAVVDINRLGQLSLNNTYIGWGHSINDKGYETEFDREYSVELSEQDLNYYLDHINRNGDKSVKASDIKKVKIADSLQAILNAFVDIAKDPYITRGNWVTNTTNTGNMMIRSGMHPLYVTAFIGQPVIRQYIDFVSNNESKTVDNTGDMKFKFMKTFVLDSLRNEEVLINGKSFKLEPIYDALVNSELNSKEKLNENSIAKQLGVNLNKATKDTKDIIDSVKNTLLTAHNEFFEADLIDITKINLKRLREQINNPEAQVQQAVLFKFFELQELSKNIRENVDVSKVDTNGHGKNINSLYIINNLYNHILNKEDLGIQGSLNGFGSKFIQDNEYTTLGHYYENSINEIKRLVESNPLLFPQANPLVQDVFNEIAFDVNDEILLDEKLGDKLEKEYYSYVISNFEPFNLTREEYAELINNVPKEFIDFKKNNKDKYLILQELETKVSSGFTFIGLNSRKKSPDFEQAFVDSWRDLLRDNPTLGERLIQYSFISSGFQMNLNQFFTYIPHEWLVNNGFNNFIKEYNNNLTEEFKDDFINKMYLNNTSDFKLVPKTFFNRIEGFTKTTNAKGKVVEVYNEGFTMKDSGKSRYFLQLPGVKTKNYLGEMTEGKPRIYKLEGYTEDFRGIYKRVDTLGFKDKRGNKLVEYLDSTVLVPKNQRVKPIVIDNIILDRNYFLNKSEQTISEQNEDIILNNVNLWSENESNIKEKFPDLTEEQFNLMSLEEQNKLIECL